MQGAIDLRGGTDPAGDDPADDPDMPAVVPTSPAVLAAADDRTLMAAAASSTSGGAALAELYRRYERPLLAYGRRCLDDRMDAEELLQETILGLWKMAPRFDQAKGSVECLAFTIAARVRTDILRRRSTRPVSCDSPVVGTVDDHGAERDLAVDVRAALSSLSTAHEAVLRLAYFEGLSQPEIAVRLGIPVGTVKTRTYWALRNLHAALTTTTVPTAV